MTCAPAVSGMRSDCCFAATRDGTDVADGSGHKPVRTAPAHAESIHAAGGDIQMKFPIPHDIKAKTIPGTEVQYLPWPQDRYFVETGDFIADISKITAATDWAPHTSLQEGIEKTVAYYQRHREHYW